jgi:bifunctional enzyme CysN/CysC
MENTVSEAPGASGYAPLADAGAATNGLLRFLTCGSVDDGKSTLIGRLLYDSKQLFEDQVNTLTRDSRQHGTDGDNIDFALLVDGLEAEREQGITIDVAYRFFATEKRSFIVADTPGHEQYTRNMATGASTADLAVLLIDARLGVLTQTRRHAFIASLLGIRHLVLAVNKIDLVGFDQDRFDEICADFRSVIEHFSFRTVTPIPLSARYGDNVTSRSVNTPWYNGPTLLEHLETVPLDDELTDKPFRLPVQWVNRPNLDFRGFAGTIASGVIHRGDAVTVAGSGVRSSVARIVTFDGDLETAGPGKAVTLTLADEVDCSRGDILVRPEQRPEVSDQFAAHVVWMSETPMLAGRVYLLKIGTRSVAASVTDIRHKIDVNTFAEIATRSLSLNEVGVCNLSLASAIAFDPYSENHRTGAFIVIDRATNVHHQAMTVDKQAHVRLNGHKPFVLWFTGLSGSGKSTIANLVEAKLYSLGYRTYALDGDNVRHGLNRDLGFTDADRVENIRRVAEVSKLFCDAGIVTLVSFISPFRAERQMARDMLAQGEFIEVFVDTPIDVCRQRDPKGLYRKADAGQIKNFTGISSPYEAPANPELHLETVRHEPVELADRVIAMLIEREEE